MHLIRSGSRVALLLTFLLLAARLALPQETYVPDALSDWQEWVLDGKEYRNCAFYFDRSPTQAADFVCTWPGTLDLRVTSEGGEFTQDWRVLAGDAWLPLPGSVDYWPDAVTVNGSAAPAVLHQGVPSLPVPAGRYRVSGHFKWDTRPGALPVPPQSGLVALTLNDQRVERPEVNRNMVFLGERTQATEAEDKIDVRVYRLLVDDIPTRLLTHLEIDVAGAVREELIGPILPAGFIPVAQQSALPVRLEADGKLRVQVRPGRWQLILTARAPEVLNELPFADSTAATGRANLPDSEIWSYQGNDRLRVTAAEADSPVDPAQAEVPGVWQALPAFRMRAGQTLLISERSRGGSNADNDLVLDREMWLDFNGRGYTVLDELSGTMRSHWRLDMRAPYILKSAREEGQDLLVTAGELEGSTGVELRRADLGLTALARVDTRDSLSVGGWSERFSEVSALLYLPPGNKLLLARGADTAHGSWFGKWKLLDFFLVLIITIAAARLFGAPGGALALFALVFSFHELAAPTWLWLNILAAVALLRVAPPGRLRTIVRSYFALSAVLLLLALVPFITQQLRIAVYPQLEPQYSGYQYSGFTDALRSPASAPPADYYDGAEENAPVRQSQPAMKQAGEPDLESLSRSLEEVVVTGNRQEDLSGSMDRYAPNAVIQAGAGIPSWHWNVYRLDWSGPVDADQEMSLVILPRWAVTLFRIIEVLLLLLLAAVIAGELMRGRWRLPVIGRTAVSPVLIVLLTFVSTDGDAQMPSPELLHELEERLLEPPSCAPRCAEISNATVSVVDDSVRIVLAIGAFEEVAIPLPGSVRGWRPDAVSLAGNERAEVLLGADQLLWLRVTPGRHTVTLIGSAMRSGNLEIVFPTPPRVIEARGQGWSIAGIKDRRLLSGALQLTRTVADDNVQDNPLRWESSRFPPFVHIYRTIALGLDWRVTTVVERVAPAEGALSLNVPLLPGESVLTASMQVREGKLLVSMSPNQGSVRWQSTLPLSTPLTLTAGAGVPWRDSWYVAVGSTWHASFSGVPESDSGNAAGGIRTAEFHPRGGEMLTIDASRPEAVAGSTIAFDRVHVVIDQGARSRTTNLALDYRSTRGAQHLVQLPVEAELMRVAIDTRDEPLRADKGRLTLPILPGEHSVEIEWRETGAVTMITRTPAVDIAAPASNIGLDLTLPENRWLLLASGPRLGPAVLYWSELAALILFAFLLAKLSFTPLRFHHWLLLGIGFSTFSWGVLALVALWLIVVSARDKWRVEGPWWVYNLVQVAVVTLTVMAVAGIIGSLPSGLLGAPDMQVTGNDSYSNHLSWFADRSESLIPTATAFSVPILVYKVLILVWALWLSLALVKWLPWTWQCFARDGFFRSRPDKNSQASA